MKSGSCINLETIHGKSKLKLFLGADFVSVALKVVSFLRRDNHNGTEAFQKDRAFVATKSLHLAWLIRHQ